MYKHILCPIDGSAISNRGLKEAINLAKDQDAQLHLLHVIDTYFPVLDGMGDLMIANITDVFRKNANKVVKKAKAIAEKAGIEVETKFLETLGVRAATLIVQEANAWPADLIVMGTHGSRGIRHLVMGSEAEHVLLTTKTPVMLVKVHKKY